MPPATLEKLSNGMRLALAPDANAESVTLALFVASGSRHEPAALSGISHFIEHMLFKGTKLRTALDITQAIEGRGGNFNAATGEDYTCFFATLPWEFLPVAAEILSDMYLNASIPDAEFERERRVVEEEIKMYDDDPSSVVDENLSAALFKGHPLARPVVGFPRTLDAMTPQTLRDYMAKCYVPEATVAVVSGRFDPADARALVTEYFGALSGGRAPRSPRFRRTLPVTPEIKAARDVQQLQLAVGYRTFGRSDPRRWALMVFDNLMGRSMSSRLFQTIRERRGLSYDIRSCSQLFADTGAWAVFMGLDPKKESEALAALDREFAKIKAKRPSAAELRRTKDYIEGSFRLGLEAPRSRVFHLGPSVLYYSRIVPVEEVVGEIEKVTAEDVTAVANDILDNSMRSVSRVVPAGRAK